MIKITGTVQNGIKNFSKLFTNYPHIFEKATGEKLVLGTINVNVERQIQINEHFRVKGPDVGDSEQDYKFEICRINGVWAYRIRPFNTKTGSGGHGDHILEIACSKKIEGIEIGSKVEIELFR